MADLIFSQSQTEAQKSKSSFTYTVSMVKVNKNIFREKVSPDQVPTICLGMPLYNQTKYLQKALDSLLVQTYGNFRLVIADDSTEPGPSQIVKSFSDKDSRITYYKNETRMGLVDNWKNCFRLAGDVDYFAWVGDHDVWHPEWLKSMVQVLDNHPDTVLVYPKTVRVDSEGEKKRDKKPVPIFSTLGLNNAERVKAVCRNGRHFGKMVYGLFRAEALRRAGVFRRVLYPDVILLLELSLQGDIHQVDANLWYLRNTIKFSIDRQKKSLFVKKPWYLFLPWPLVNTCALIWNTAVRADKKARRSRILGLKLALMYLQRWSIKYGDGSWIGSYDEWRRGKKPLIKKLKRRLKEKNNGGN